VPAAPVQRSEELAILVRRFYEATVAGDEETVGSFFSDDPCCLSIGSDAAEWFEGPGVAAAIHRKQIQEAKASGGRFVLAIHPGRLDAFAEGTIGWVQDDPTFVMPSGAKLAGRATMVLRREGMYWHIVQAHLSFGHPNLETFEWDYTTGMQAIVESVEADRPDLHHIVSSDGTVTIVFTDVEASTEIAERLGDERFVELLRWLDDVVRSTATALSGTVVKSEGDGYMLAFASASNALDFAIALEASTFEGHLGQATRVRIGLNSGDVVRERDDFFGRAVTVAARVAGQAQGGEILATDTVAALVSGSSRFTFGPTRVVDLKGIQGSVALRPLQLPDR
jgi:class 3 adenylate cyclase